MKQKRCSGNEGGGITCTHQITAITSQGFEKLPDLLVIAVQHVLNQILGTSIDHSGVEIDSKLKIGAPQMGDTQT